MLKTYGSILGGFGLAALECHSVTLVLEALRGDEALDAGGFGVGFFAFAFRLDFAADDEFADLVVGEGRIRVSINSITQYCSSRRRCIHR